MLKVGDRVKAVNAIYGWGEVEEGDIGTILEVGIDGYIVQFPANSHWTAAPGDVVLVTTVKERRTAKKLVPSTEREKIAVRLIKKVTNGEGKFTAVKVESEGNMQRRDRCTARCTLRGSLRKPHVGCKYFEDVKVANDFILRELAKQGLAKRCRQGTNPWGYLYAPKLPLVFSKVYTDSETEWTTTLSLKNASDVLYTPYLVDAFNALAAANGNGIDVERSGMHTAFIQGQNGMYPDPRGRRVDQNHMFENYAKSMRPLLPALYLLGANRIENGKGVTRSTSPRQPMISSSEKYSAIAYRYGAVEFRVFDTCYEHRDQLLDNIVVMAQSISKYWHKTYVKPNIELDKPVFFGSTDCTVKTTNSIESLYIVKEHIVLLNKGLRCIKPPYMTVKEVKQVRNFRLTVRGIKNILDTDAARTAYDQHLRDIELKRAVNAASEFYGMVDALRYRGSLSLAGDIKKELRRLRAKASRMAKSHHPVSPLEQIAYEAQFGGGFPLGGK